MVQCVFYPGGKDSVVPRVYFFQALHHDDISAADLAVLATGNWFCHTWHKVKASAFIQKYDAHKETPSPHIAAAVISCVTILSFLPIFPQKLLSHPSFRYADNNKYAQNAFPISVFHSNLMRYVMLETEHKVPPSATLLGRDLDPSFCRISLKFYPQVLHPEHHIWV